MSRVTFTPRRRLEENGNTTWRRGTLLVLGGARRPASEACKVLRARLPSANSTSRPNHDPNVMISPAHPGHAVSAPSSTNTKVAIDCQNT